MWCPKCGSEYQEGIIKCAECEVRLVKEAPKQPKPEYIEFEEILSTFNPADIAIIKSLLDADKITYYFDGENFLYARPLAIPARLMVKKDQVEDAKNILRDLKLGWSGINPPR